MTRETRIGLLVGLAFIFAFGLILGELTNTDPPAFTPASIRDVDYLGNEVTRRPIADDRTYRHESPRRSTRAARTGRTRRNDARRDRSARRGSDSSSRSSDRRRTYVTRQGDTLTSIARRQYGREHAGEYRRIYEANRNVLRSVDVVPVGKTLVIPDL
jgi:nucleoid-associated protein YgaU